MKIIKKPNNKPDHHALIDFLWENRKETAQRIGDMIREFSKNCGVRIEPLIYENNKKAK